MLFHHPTHRGGSHPTSTNTWGRRRGAPSPAPPYPLKMGFAVGRKKVLFLKIFLKIIRFVEPSNDDEGGNGRRTGRVLMRKV